MSRQKHSRQHGSIYLWHYSRWICGKIVDKDERRHDQIDVFKLIRSLVDPASAFNKLFTV